MSFIAASVIASLETLETVNPAEGRKLIFKEEFNRQGQPNQKTWLYEHGMVRNGEAQFYTRDRQENARQEGGNLVIEARKEKWEKAEVTSASLTSRKAFLHNYVEVRAKFPTGRGTWPAIWLLAESIRAKGDKYMPWPLCGEIDMMENVGFDPEVIHFTIHTEAYNHTKGTQKAAQVRVPRAWDEFHTYGLDWKKDRLDFYFNGKKVFTYAKEADKQEVWPFDKPHYLILNLAIGGGWGGARGIDDAIFPSKFLIDYVRVYQ